VLCGPQTLQQLRLFAVLPLLCPRPTLPAASPPSGGGLPPRPGCHSYPLHPLSSSLPSACSPAAFPFFYIEPKRFKHIIDRFNPKGVAIDQFDAIGNSPVQIHKRQFAGIVDKWFNLSIAIKQVGS
jgi:hypothetical protein